MPTAKRHPLTTGRYATTPETVRRLFALRTARGRLIRARAAARRAGDTATEAALTERLAAVEATRLKLVMRGGERLP